MFGACYPKPNQFNNEITKMAKEENTFDKMAAAEAPAPNDAPKAPEQKEEVQQPAQVGELDLDQLSNKPVGEKFERVLLDGKTVTISDAQLFPANPASDELKSGFRNKTKKYYTNNLIVHYDEASVPEDKPQREYYSGAVQHTNDNNILAANPTVYWTKSKTQAADLWRAVAKARKVEPEGKDGLDLRSFMVFLKSKPKAIIEVRTFENPITGKEVQKNMIKEFVA